MQDRLKLKDLATKINAHLSRIEADPRLNVGGDLFYYPGASVAGRFVRVCYKSFQGRTCISKEVAAAYLAWLDAGNCGRHFEAQRANWADNPEVA